MRNLWLVILLTLTATGSAQVMDNPKNQCERLMNAAVPFAEQMLKEHGEFFPYGAAMKPDGGIVSVGGYDGREQPPSTDIINLVKGSFVKGAAAGEYKATALVYDVRVSLPSDGTKSDAIAVALDHQDNYSVVVFLPYQLQDGALSFGDMFSQAGDSDIF